MANSSTTELDLLKSATASGGATDSLNVSGSVTSTVASTQVDRLSTGAVNGTITGVPLSVTFDTTGFGSITLHIQTIGTSTIQFFGSVDGITYTGLFGTDIGLLNGNLILNTNIAGLYQFPISGFRSFKMTTLSSFTGIVTYAICGSPSANSFFSLLNTTFVSGTVGVSSLPATAANAVAQASTTAGQTGTLVQSATTTNAPTYTTAKTNPLSSDVSGNIRVSLKDSPANTNKFLVTADPITFASAQSVNATLAAETTKVIGTVNIASSQSVTANAGTNLNTSALALDTSVSGLSLSQASTTSGQKGVLAQGAVTTNAPSYTTAQTDPLSLDTSGLLRVSIKDTPQNTTAFKVDGSATTQPVNNTQINGNAILAGNGITGTGSQRVTIASDNTAFSVNATPPTLTKGTQGATGYSVQLLKDAGRTHINFYASGAAAGTTGTETAITLTKSSGTASTTTGTSFVVTSGKTYRMTSITFGTRGNTTATAEITTFSIRINTGGAVITSSTPITVSARSGNSATSLAYDRLSVDLGGDGYEIVGDGTLQFGVTANSVYTTNAPTWDVLITGFEY